jgi:PAS domain S-box-containing protein
MDHKITHQTRQFPMKITDYYKHLNNMAGAVQLSLQLNEILDTIISEVMIALNVSAAEIFLYEKTNHLLTLKSQRGLSPEMAGCTFLQQGEGLAGSVAAKKEPLFITELDAESGIPAKIIRKDNLVAYAGVPLSSKGALVGVLGLYTRSERSFNMEEQQLLLEMGEIAGQAIQNGLHYQEASLRAQRFIAVSRAITVTQKIDSLDTVLENLTKVVVQSLGFDGAWIGLVNEDHEIEGRAGFGIGLKSKSIHLKYPLNSRSKNPVTQCLVLREPLVFQFQQDVSDADFRRWLADMKIQSLGLVPIISGKRDLGVMAAYYCHDQSFDDGGLKALRSVAEQSAIAIENSRLYEQTKQSEDRYRILFESAGPSLVIIDQNQTFQLVNCAFEALCGYNREDLIGKRTLDLFVPSLKEKFDATIPGHFETEFRDRNELIKQIHLTSTPIPGMNHMLISLVDMTIQRELERRLYRSEELAALGELSAGIAHEIRNPLVAIKTSVGLLQDESALSEEGHQLLEVVAEETDQMAAIVEDFLQFARPKPPSLEEVNLNQVLRDVVKRYREVKQKKTVQWSENMDEKLPLLWIDRYQIQQVITNLILNSLDALEQGGRLEIDSFLEEGELSRVCFSVTDTGLGIQPECIHKIFQPFFSTKQKGTGMGLAICRRIIDQHGGEIRVESRAGEKTTFTVLLPVQIQQ